MAVKGWLRTLTVGLVVFLTTGLLAGCGSAGTPAFGSAASTAAASTGPSPTSTAASTTGTRASTVTSGASFQTTSTKPASGSGKSDIEQIRLALVASDRVVKDFSMEDYLILDEWAGVVTGSPTVGNCAVLLRRSGENWTVVTLGTDVSRNELLGFGAPREVAEFLTPWETLAVIRDAIAGSGSVALDFVVSDYLLSGEWAGIIISSPGVEDCAVLAAKSGPDGWHVVDLGTGLTKQDWIDEGAPAEIAAFLSPAG